MDIVLENVSYSYPGSGIEALKNINLEVKSGTMLAVMGKSGSGKSTLLRLFNALIAPQRGRVLADGDDINLKGYDRKKLREKVGLVFQYPETQLFEETVLKDVAFGPLNRGRTEEEAIRDAKNALSLLSVSEDSWARSPFALSGGEKRKVALSGIISIGGDVLVLDEISSGLDGKSRKDIFTLLNKLNREGRTIIFTSHDPEEVALYSKEVILLEKGEIKVRGTFGDISSYDGEYMTEGEKLKMMLEREGVRTGRMYSIDDSLSSLSALLRKELHQGGKEQG